MIRTAASVLSLLLSALLLNACGGPKRPDLEPPEVTIVELTLSNGEAEVQIRVDNTVAAPMELARMQLTLAIRGQRDASFDVPFDLTIPPLGSEVVTRTMSFRNAGREQMEYRLDGAAVLVSGRSLPFEREGRLYPTPGKPGSFR